MNLVKCMPEGTVIRQPSKMELLRRNPNCVGMCITCGEGLYQREVYDFMAPFAVMSRYRVPTVFEDVPHECAGRGGYVSIDEWLGVEQFNNKCESDE